MDIKKLKNGATKIIVSKSYVLARWEKYGRYEYITWLLDKNGDTHNGHYFTNPINAITDLLKRSRH